MLDRYFRERAALRLVVILVDARRGPEDLEADLVEYLSEVRDPPIPHVYVATKIDKVPRSMAKTALGGMSERVPGRLLGFSSKTGTGRRDIWRYLLGFVKHRCDGSQS